MQILWRTTHHPAPRDTPDMCCLDAGTHECAAWTSRPDQTFRPPVGPKVTFGERWLTWRKHARRYWWCWVAIRSADPGLTGHELQQWPGQSQPEYKSYLRFPTYVTASWRSLMS